MTTFFKAISAHGDPEFIYYKDGDEGMCLWKVRRPMPHGKPLRSLTGIKLSSDQFTEHDSCDDCKRSNATNTLYVRYKEP